MALTPSSQGPQDNWHSHPQRPAEQACEIKIETKEGVKAYNESQDAPYILLSPQRVCVHVCVQARVVCVSVSVCV